MQTSLNQNQTPFFKALTTYTRQHKLAFHTPGHKYGAGIDTSLIDFIGPKTFEIDLCELDEVDNLHDPKHVLKEAMALASEAYGADHSFFLVNGSTCGNQAMILSTCQPGDKILVPRNMHKSVVNALLLSGAVPVYLIPPQHPKLGFALNVTAEDVEKALLNHQDIKAVLVVNPTYEGITADLQKIKHLCQTHGALLLVDEAHGAHFHFHPDLPLSAVDIGADMVVQSTHKTLAGMTQTAMLHVNGNRVNLPRLRQVLQIVQSSSPNYVLMASLDVARFQMATQGKQHMQHALDISRFARTALNKISGVYCIGAEIAGIPGCFSFDESKLTLGIKAMTGFELCEVLNTTYDIQIELAAQHHIMALVSFANTQSELEGFVAAVKNLTQNIQQATDATPRLPSFSLPDIPTLEITPRDAFYAVSESVELNRAVGRICTETLCPYPPGIPVILPGERVTQSVIDTLKTIHHAGGLINGLADPTLKTLRVVLKNPTHSK